VPNNGYKQKACHNFCIAPGQFHHYTELIAVYKFQEAGSGQFVEPGQNFRSPGFANIAPWCLARQDSLSAKEPGQLTGVTSPPTLSTHTRVPL
jgi:hypothetical protein